MASFGAFIIPSVLAVATAQRTLAEVMLGFAAYYLFCFVLNFFFYLRPDYQGKGQGCVLPQPCLDHRVLPQPVSLPLLVP